MKKSVKKGKMLSVQEAVARLGLTPSTSVVNEPEKDRVLDDLTGWLKARLDS